MIENALLAIVCNAIGGLIATYIARAIDNKRKNDRHRRDSSH